MERFKWEDKASLFGQQHSNILFIRSIFQLIITLLYLYDQVLVHQWSWWYDSFLFIVIMLKFPLSNKCRKKHVPFQINKKSRTMEKNISFKFSVQYWSVNDDHENPDFWPTNTQTQKLSVKRSIKWLFYHVYD